jgi:SAM-dependent methyltransferase
MKYSESILAHAYLDGLSGLEIGGSAHNSFGLNTRNVDYSSGADTAFKQEEIEYCGSSMPVDIVAPGDKIPVPDESEDFIISSHVIEDFPDPIKALKEWYRIVKPEGYIYIIAPHKERTFDKDRPRTVLKELITRHESSQIFKSDPHVHYSVWVTDDLVELIKYLGWQIVYVQDIDDKVGNGFTVVIQKSILANHACLDIDFRLRALLFQKSGILLKDSNNVNDIISKLVSLINVNEECATNKDSLNDSVKPLLEEVEMMKNSKFWKMRNVYLHYRGLLMNNRGK